MGTESSIENTPTNSYINNLLSLDYTEDYHFWYEYLKNSPDRLLRPPPSPDNPNDLGSQVVPPDARFLFEVAEKKSKNFENFILTSIKEITDAAKVTEARNSPDDDDTDNNNRYDLTNEQNLNAIHFALTTLPTALTLLLKNKKFVSSLAFLDSGVFDEVVKVFPDASEFSKRKKKVKKSKKIEKQQINQQQTANEKNEEEDEKDDEEKENENETSNQAQTATAQPQKKKKKLSPERQLRKNERLHYLHMRRQRGSIFSLLTGSLIDLLFKSGLTISINKSPNSNDKTPFWCHSSYHVDQIRYDIVHNLVFLSSIIDSSSIYKLQKPVTSFIESFSSHEKEFPLTQFLISITNMEFATATARHEPITSRLLQNCIALVISLFQFTSIKESLRSIDARTFARVFFAPKKVVKKSKDENNTENTFERLFGHFLIRSPNKLYVEWISLLFISFFSNQTFLKQVVRCPSAAKEVIEFILSQPVVEQGSGKVSYIHSVILTTLLFILQNAPPPPELQLQLKKAKEEALAKSEVNDQNPPKNENTTKKRKKLTAAEKEAIKLEFKKRYFITYLDDPFAPTNANSDQKTHLDDDGSGLADFIVNKLLNFCQTETFLPSFICALHLIVPHITDFTLETALNIFKLYEKSPPEVKSQFLDIFATVVQIPKRHSSIKTIILMKTNLFKSSAFTETTAKSAPSKSRQQSKSAKPSSKNKRKNDDVDDDDEDSDDDNDYDEYEDDEDDDEEEENKGSTKSEQMKILHKFISRCKKILLKKVSSNEHKTIDINQIADVMCKMNIKLKKMFPNRKSFLKHPVTNGAEIEKAWGEWAILICKKTSLNELKSLRMVADMQE